MSKVVATFTVPAIYSQREERWIYSALRFVVTDTADEYLVRYLLSLNRVD